MGTSLYNSELGKALTYSQTPPYHPGSPVFQVALRGKRYVTTTLAICLDWADSALLKMSGSNQIMPNFGLVIGSDVQLDGESLLKVGRPVIIFDSFQNKLIIQKKTESGYETYPVEFVNSKVKTDINVFTECLVKSCLIPFVP